MRKPSSAGYRLVPSALARAGTVALALLMLMGAYLPPAHAAQGAATAPLRLRIGVVKDGITVITPGDVTKALTDAGIDPATIVDPQTFAMTSLGHSVRTYLDNQAPLDTFAGADRLYFFGEKFRSADEMEQKYTDERVYWLDIGGTPGLQMDTVDATPHYDVTPPSDFLTTLRAEQSLIWWTLHSLSVDTKDTWFWARVQPSSNTPAPPSVSATATLSYFVPYPANSPGALRLEEVSNAFLYGPGPDHRTTASLNGTPVLDQNWESPGIQQRIVLNASVPGAALTHGQNSLAVSAWTVPGAYGDDVYINYWELDYRRRFVAWQDQLDFKAETSGTQEYAPTGFSGRDVWIWDVTDSDTPVRLTLPASGPPPYRLFLPLVSGGKSGAPSPGATIRFRVNATAGNRYWLQTARTVQSPASVKLRPPTNLRDRKSGEGADAVIVTSAELIDEAKLLAAWHEARGRQALVVDIQDAYDEFNDGILHPSAVQAMMQYAVVNWTPAPIYLTLFGDGHWNFKNYNPTAYPGGPNHVPPYLAWADPWQGEVPVDGLYGDINGDTLPEIAVGRIAVETKAEAGTVVDKITHYDEYQRVSDWQRRALFVADDADGAGDFPTVSDLFALNQTYTPSDLAVTRVYLPSPPSPPNTAERAAQVAETRAALQTAINDGVFMVQYTGHGAPERWAGESILTTGDIVPSTMTNGSRLPVVLTFNCLDGYFAHADRARISIAESMQRLAIGGSIAAISPAGLGTTDAQQAFREILLTVMFTENVRELGKALTIAKQRFAQMYGYHYLTQTMMLFGDPALRLPAAP